MTVYCISCGFNTYTSAMVCEDCSIANGVPTCFVPALCQDELCYVMPNGEINLDGDCDHADKFYEVFQSRGW